MRKTGTRRICDKQYNPAPQLSENCAVLKMITSHYGKEIEKDVKKDADQTRRPDMAVVVAMGAAVGSNADNAVEAVNNKEE